MTYPTIESMKVLRYFSYTSIVTDRLLEEGTESELEFIYDECCEKAEEINPYRHYADNKSAFEILVKGRVMYIGCYDGKYSLGFGISGIGGNYVIDFLTGEESEYGHHNA